jgi:hypothetical protein
MTDIKAAAETAQWFTPLKMVSEDPLRYELCLGTEEATFGRIAGHLKERGWVEESDGIWTPPDDATGRHRA